MPVQSTGPVSAAPCCRNNGVIAITRCASRAAGIACCIWLILFGCFEKFGACIASIPDCVLGGAIRS